MSSHTQRLNAPVHSAMLNQRPEGQETGPADDPNLSPANGFTAASDGAQGFNAPLLQAIFNTTADAILVSDDQGRYLSANPAAGTLLGLPADTIPGRSVQDLFFPHDPAGFQQAWQHVLSRTGVQGEIRYAHPDGSIRVFEYHCNADALPGKHLSILRDISRRKQAEQRQAEMEALLSATFQQAAVGLAHIEPNTFRFLKVNHKFCDIVGYPEEELLKLTFPDITYPEDLAADLTQANQLFSGEIPTFSMEKRYIKKNGDIAWVHLTCSAIRNHASCPDTGIAVIQDITQRKMMEAHLKRTEARFQQVIQSSVIGIVLGDLTTGKILEVNETFTRMVGYDREDFLSGRLSWSDITPPEYRHLDERAIRNLLETGSSAPFEKEYQTRDGNRIDVLVAGTLLDETRDKVIVFILNITARKQAEALLQKNEERYRLVVESTNDGVWDWNIQTGESYWNKRYFEILGLSPDEPTPSGEDWFALVHPDDRDTLQAMFSQHLESHTRYEYEFRIRHASGEYRYCSSRGELVRDEQGNPIRMAGLLTDITERKQAEIALQKTLEQERLIRNIVEVVSRSLEGTVIWETTARDLARFFQADRCTISGFIRSDEELIPQIIGQYCSDSDIPKLSQEDSPMPVMKALTRNIPGHGSSYVINLPTVYFTSDEVRQLLDQYQIYPADYSESFDIEAFTENSRKYHEKYGNKSTLAIEIFYRGISYGAISLYQCKYHRIWTDEEVQILEAIAPHVGAALYQAELYQQEQQARNNLQRYAERLEQSNRELENFATITSHDLQAPLRKVRLFADHLKQVSGDSLSQEALDDIMRMQRATARMQNLITDLLDLSRVTRKGEPFCKVNLGNVIREAVADLQYRIEETGGTVEIHGSIELEGDPSQLRQLFQNLIENGLKYHRKQVAPIIKINAEKVDGHACRITVEDNGLGFNEKYLDRIFQVFQRLHNEASEYEGTGIGLAICQKITERHNGTITATSKEGVGSTFQVVLPIRQVLVS